MPLQPGHKSFIANSVDHLFCVDSEHLPTFIQECRKAFQEAFVRDLTKPVRVKLPNGSESESQYQIFLCATQPETQFKGMEKQQGPLSVFEAQEYFLFYTLCRLQFQLANPNADEFEINKWLLQFTEEKADAPATTSDWLKRIEPTANTRLADWQWDVSTTLNQLHALQERNATPFQTRSPDNQGAGDFDWTLPKLIDRIFEVRLDVREEKAFDADGTAFIDPHIDFTLTIDLTTQTFAPAPIEDFRPYPASDDEQQKIKRAAMKTARGEAREKAFHFLNRITRSKLTFDNASIGLILLTYRYYFHAVLTDQLSLAFFFTLTLDDVKTLANPLMIEILKNTNTSIDIVKALPAHTQRLLKIDIYANKVRGGEISLLLLQAESIEQSQVLLMPAAINLQRLGKIRYAVARIMSRHTTDVLGNEFYYESVRDDKIAIAVLHPLDNDQKNRLLDEDVITLIKHEVITIEIAKNLSPAAMRLIKNVFIFYLLKNDFIDGRHTLLTISDANERQWRDTTYQQQAIDDIAQKDETLTKQQYMLMQSLVNLSYLQKKTLSSVKIDPSAPGLLLLAIPYYVKQIAEGNLTLEFIQHLNKDQASRLQHPVVVAILENDCGEIEFAKNLSAQEMELLNIKIYQQRILNKQTSLLSLMGMSPAQKAVLLIRAIIIFQKLDKLTFETASTTTPGTANVLSHKYYYAAAVASVIPMTAFDNLTPVEENNLLNEDIIALQKEGAIDFDTAKNPPEGINRYLKKQLLNIAMNIAQGIEKNPERTIAPFYIFVAARIAAAQKQEAESGNSTGWQEAFDLIEQRAQGIETDKITGLTLYDRRSKQKLIALCQNIATIANDLNKLRPVNTESTHTLATGRTP
jgi:hypothetical protein